MHRSGPLEDAADLRAPDLTQILNQRPVLRAGQNRESRWISKRKLILASIILLTLALAVVVT